MSTTEVNGRYALRKEARLVTYKDSLYVPNAVIKNGKALGEPKYNAQFIIVNPDDIAAIKAKAVEVARAKWPTVDLKTLHFPFTSGDKLADKAKAEKKDRESYRGSLVVSSRSKFQPRLAVFQGGKAPLELGNEQLLAAHRSKFYAGALVLVQFNFVAYDGVGTGQPGVTAYLDQVMWVKDGERLGGGSAAEAFKHYQGSVSPEDPTGGAELDDEIPF